MIDKLKRLVDKSQSILITSHISPDGDSVSSSLLLFQILKLNYPEKNVFISMEEAPYGLDFLSEYSSIKFMALKQAIEDMKPDLLFVLDASGLSRLTRQANDVKPLIDEELLKVIVIDHHEGNDMPEAEMHINRSSPAVTLDIYELFIEQLGLKKPQDYAQTALTGIYTDTGGFIHRNLNFEKVFETVPKLIKDGADLEALIANLSKVSEKSLAILRELLENVSFKQNFTYSYISDESAVAENHEALVQASELFRTNFIRNVDGKPWGFIVQRDVMASEKTYSVSMRSLTEYKDVSVIAKQLGGGGHKPAAGAKFPANNIREAVDKVLAAIEQTPSS